MSYDELLIKYQQLNRDQIRILNLYMDAIDVIMQINHKYPMILKDALGEEKLKEFLGENNDK